MAYSDNSIITGKLRGSLGKQLVFRQWAGKTVVAKAPKPRTVEPTTAQSGIMEKFLLASRYAKSIIKSVDQSMALAYQEVLKPRQNVYSRALEDFMTPPVVKQINTAGYKGQAGDKILARAIDDFRVTAVRVEIYASDGSLVEAGDATQDLNGIDWIYTATQAHNPLTGSKIKALASDVPGNIGMLELTL